MTETLLPSNTSQLDQTLGENLSPSVNKKGSFSSEWLQICHFKCVDLKGFLKSSQLVHKNPQNLSYIALTRPQRHTSCPVLRQLQQCVLSSYLPPCSSPPHKQAVKGPEKGREGKGGNGSCIPPLRTCWNSPPLPNKWSERLAKPNICCGKHTQPRWERVCILAVCEKKTSHEKGAGWATEYTVVHLISVVFS